MSELIYDKSIQDVLPARFLDYSVAVLRDRAIPDGFDGLKPIHRRVLLAMNDLKLASNAPHRKCAKTIGEVLGKYHPHGDQSAYEALVGLAQDFNMRYPLIEGSGNFGSVNGDPAAAMRYTEARLSPFGELMLEDVGKLSDMKDNFDGSCKEAVTLSSYWPNLLCNPCYGIAVGFATKFAPHYAKDVYTALIRSLELERKGKTISFDELADIIQAPDFPTGAQIINGSAMREMYRTGKGSVQLRAKYRIEKNSIVYYEIPYKVSPKSIIEDIAKLDNADIRDVRDESSIHTGIRIVVELKKGCNPEYIVNLLFKETKLQSVYSVNMVAVIENKPVSDLSLDRIVAYYIARLKLVHRKSREVERKDVEGKLFVVETMLKAINCIEDIVRIVRGSDVPIEDMQAEFGFSREEAEYIYNIRISSLSKANKTDLDRKQKEYKERIIVIDKILTDDKAFLGDLAAKLKVIRDGKLLKGDERRTEILDLQPGSAEADEKAFIKKEPVVVTYSNIGMIKVVSADTYKVASRNTVGTKSALREGEYIVQSVSLTTHDEMLFVSDAGKAYIVPVFKFGISSKSAQGRSINNYIQLGENEKIILVRVLPDGDGSLALFTSCGKVKRTGLEALRRCRGNFGTKAISLRDGDKLAAAEFVEDSSIVAVFTDLGRGNVFRINEAGKEVGVTGKESTGIGCMKLEKNEHVVSATIADNAASVGLITEMGLGRSIPLDSVPVKKRNQVPVRFVPDIDKTGHIVAGLGLTGDSKVLITTAKGNSVMVKGSDFRPVTKRNAKGVSMVKLAAGDSVIGMTIVADDVEKEGTTSGEEDPVLF